jgi:hypothetical protein
MIIYIYMYMAGRQDGGLQVAFWAKHQPNTHIIQSWITIIHYYTGKHNTVLPRAQDWLRPTWVFAAESGELIQRNDFTLGCLDKVSTCLKMSQVYAAGWRIYKQRFVWLEPFTDSVDPGSPGTVGMNNEPATCSPMHVALALSRIDCSQ